MASVRNAYSLIQYLGKSVGSCMDCLKGAYRNAWLLVDHLRGPAPYAFVGGHGAVGNFENCVA